MTAVDSEETANCQCEFYLTAEMGRWSTQYRREMQKDEYLVFAVNKNMISIAIKREFDNLAKEEIIQYAQLVIEAKLDERKRWHGLNCFRRMNRAEARNNVDKTWVLKWKKVRKEANAKQSWVRIFKAWRSSTRH